mgnify:CR=1 FL=1
MALGDTLRARLVTTTLVLVLASSCSKSSGDGFSPNELDAVDTLSFVDADTYDPHTGDTYEYEKRCYQDQYWYCPPLSAVWRKVVTVDICDENGDPCTASECQWSIVTMGDCEEIFECDPTGPTNLGEIVCEVDGLLGVQTKYCDKGFFSYSPCDPCTDEICDSIDNDCDGTTDEGLYPCSTDCGDGEGACINGKVTLCSAPEPTEEVCNYVDDDCDGLTDEGQTNICNLCGDVPSEDCDSFDNDCDGLIDEDLLDGCSTACGDGYKTCVSGMWTLCSAQEPQDEVCNGLDDDCNGYIDDGISCGCPPEDVGAIFPCLEPPLVCGQGYKQCACVDVGCAETAMTECHAPCHFFPIPGQTCDDTLGVPYPEVCNNHDDDCDTLIDEDLVKGCYTGPPATEGVGECIPGEMTCLAGKWGGKVKTSNTPETFVEGLCVGEVTPMSEDLCGGADNDCNGQVEKELEDTDILFIIDASGSMYEEIGAVAQAMTTFAASYSGSTAIHWGLVTGPTAVGSGLSEKLYLNQNLTEFSTFVPALSAMATSYLGGANEMLYDALYLAAHNLVDPQTLPHQISDLAWGPGANPSVPSIQGFKINWRENAHHVIIVFSDEMGQSYLKPMLSQQNLVDVLSHADDLSVYTFSTGFTKDVTDWLGNKVGWESVSVGGSWNELSTDPTKMFGALMDILDETACGGAP